ncbi:MAG: hypothetical protein IJJ21_06200 [Firmicutes bacterium]|nr:hypothetical protein [Bacillota bacterium]
MVRKKEQKKTLMQSMGVTRTVIRPREESDIRLREDRIGRYFKKYLNKFVFVEFSEDFLSRAKAADVMRGVPIPLRRKEVKTFAGGDGVPMTIIAENMVWVIGCDPHFKYTEDYVKILNKIYNNKMFEILMKEGRDAAERGEMDDACIHFRASLCFQYDYLHSMYSYARACRVMYENSRNEEYVGRFKAEALDWFELLTETHPRFAMGFYYLGYQYLNIGLYKKAVLAWEEFLKFTHNKKDRKEIRHRIEQLEDPVRIEGGCLDITSGRYEEGLAVLEPYLQSQYKNWWPLHYYLGLGYQASGRTPDAVAEFKKVLMINGSHLETMRELLAIYEAQDDKQNIRKFSEKIRLIEEAQAEEQAKQLEETEKENKKIETEEAQPLPAEKIESFDMAEADEMTGSDTSGDAKAGLAEAEAAETDAAEAEADGGAAGPKEKERKPLVKRLRK